jgi:type IV secretory pathway VirD2 relaxase
MRFPICRFGFRWPAFLDRGREDRHQFLFIVSAEEGVELTDIRETTRDLMKQMEIDLTTKLDWVAVDHHNTGHPHTHILVRGITNDGKILNIAGDYIAHGIRERASEIVTIELGHQTEHEISRQLEHEIGADRFTRLDKMLIAEQQHNDEFTDLRPDNDMTDMFRKNRVDDRPRPQAGAHGTGHRNPKRPLENISHSRADLARNWHTRRHHQDHARGAWAQSHCP